MKRIAFKPIYLVAFLIAGFSISRSASADVHGHLVALATKIDRQATRLLTETVHYRHTPNYGRMVAEVAVLRAKARHMRYTTFTSSNFHHLEEDLRMVDRCFHKVEAFFDGAEINAVHGHGHIHGNTRHVKAILNSMEDTIHHMQDDVRDLRRSVFATRGRTVIQSTVYSPPIYGSSRTIYNSGRTTIHYGGRDCDLDRRHRGHDVYRGHGGRHGASLSNGGLQIHGKNMSFRIRF